jgi:hypothetical protein
MKSTLTLLLIQNLCSCVHLPASCSFWGDLVGDHVGDHVTPGNAVIDFTVGIDVNPM